IATGTPEALKSTIGADRLDIVLRNTSDLVPAATLVAQIAGSEPEIDPDARHLSVPVADHVTALTAAVRALDAAAIPAEDIGIRRPTLDETFLRITEELPA